MRYYIPKEGVIMAEALGQELLIDLYSCDEDAISSATAVQESVATAFDLAELDVDEISCQVMDEEIALLSVVTRLSLYIAHISCIRLCSS